MQKHILFSTRLTAIVLTAVMILTMVPATVFAAGDSQPGAKNNASLSAVKKEVAKRTNTLDVKNVSNIRDKDNNTLTPTDGVVDMLDTEGWKWDSNTKTLTFNGLDADVKGDAIIFPPGTTIELVGNNSAKSATLMGLKMSYNGDLTITGTGSLSVSAKNQGIISYGNMNVSSGTIEVVSYTDNAIVADGKLEISGSANVTASGDFCGLKGASGVAISGGTIVANGAADQAIYSEGKLEISGTANVTATSRDYCGLLGDNGIVISGGTIDARSTNANAIYTDSTLEISGAANVTATGGAYCALQSAGNMTIGDCTIKAASPNNTAIFTKSALSVDENAKITATGKYNGLKATGKMSLLGQIEAKSDTGIAILSNDVMTLDNSKIHAIGASGYPAIAVLYTQTGEATPPVMIKMVNGADTLENVKPAASDWFGSGATKQSYTAFIPKTQDKLIITESGTSTNAATEVTIGSAPTPPPVYLNSIKVETPPARTAYFAGDTFDKTGMKILAVYSNGNTYDVTNNCTFKPEGPLSTEDKAIIISYSNLTVTQPITVTTAGIEKAAIKTPPSKSQYITGETFDPTGLVIELTYENGEKKEVVYNDTTKDQFTFKPTLNSGLRAADKEIIINYEGQALKQEITVLENIVLNKKTATLYPGQTLKLTPTTKPSNTKVTWSSSNSKVAKVSQKGAVTAVGRGSAVISVRTANGGKATCNVTVTFNPPMLKAKAAGSTAVSLSWKAVKGAYGYQIYRATSSKGKYVKVKTTAKTAYTNEKLTTGKSYYYKVRAYSKVSGITGFSSFSKAVSTVPEIVAPSFKLTAGAKKIIVKWSTVKGVDGYVIYRGGNAKGPYKKLTIRSKNATKYTSLHLKSGKTYYYKMRSYQIIKGKKVYSAISPAVGKKAK